MLNVHQIALDLNNKQRTFFVKSAGTARFSYNRALARWKEQYATGDKPGEVSLRRELNSIKKEVDLGSHHLATTLRDPAPASQMMRSDEDLQLNTHIPSLHPRSQYVYYPQQVSQELSVEEVQQVSNKKKRIIRKLNHYILAYIGYNFKHI